MKGECVQKHKLPNGDTIKFYLTKRNEGEIFHYYFAAKDPLTGLRKQYRGTTKAETRDSAIDFIDDLFFTEIKTGIYFQKEEKKKQGLSKRITTFKEISDKFKEFKLKRDICEKVKRQYISSIDHLCKYFGKMPLELVGKQQEYSRYQEFRIKNMLNENGKLEYKINGKLMEKRIPSNIPIEKFGKTQVNRDIELLFQILNWAKNEYQFYRNLGIDKFKWNPESRKADIFGDEEYKKIKEYYEKNNPYYLSIIRFIVHTGLRPNEIWSLKWKNVKFKDQIIEIEERKNTVKSSSKKVVEINSCVPIVGEAEKILHNLYNRKGIKNSSEDYVFLNDENEHITRMEKSFKNALKKCSITKNLTLNSLRHQAATRFIRKGYTIPYVKMILGHSPNSKTLETYYLHLDSDDLVKMARSKEL